MDSDRPKKQEISNDLHSEPSTIRAPASLTHGGTASEKEFVDNIRNRSSEKIKGKVSIKNRTNT
jgi:hypothetical protein